MTDQIAPMCTGENVAVVVENELANERVAICQTPKYLELLLQRVTQTREYRTLEFGIRDLIYSVPYLIRHGHRWFVVEFSSQMENFLDDRLIHSRLLLQLCLLCSSSQSPGSVSHSSTQRQKGRCRRSFGPHFLGQHSHSQALREAAISATAALLRWVCKYLALTKCT